MTERPRPAYWAFCNFNELYRLGQEVSLGRLPPNVHALAATDGKGLAKIFWANIGDKTERVDFAAPGWTMLSSQVTDDWRVNTIVAPSTALPPNAFGVLTFVGK